MIVFLIAVIVAIRILYSLAEIYFEHDWPRHTWKGLAISLILLVLCFSTF